jgi:hypothetical protein
MAVVGFEGKRSVWMPTEDNKARFVPSSWGSKTPSVRILEG